MPHNGHYWVGEHTKFTCKNCKAELTIRFEFLGGQYNTTYNYAYPNGDKSTVFHSKLSDVCPIEWDLGKWLPGAVEVRKLGIEV